ncbi:MAG: long-chain fatty acid--CoA ligase [Rhodobacteraceae bacterium]|nr:long-chain fatty acid--CoA ligase [Paracoccaceae bacterium]
MALGNIAAMAQDWSAFGADLEIVPAPDGTIASAFLAAVARRGERIAMRRKDRGLWRAIAWCEYGETVRRIALALMSKGFSARDRACILADNCPEWFCAELATITAGGVSTGIYATNSPEQTAYVINDCQARVVFVENEEQLDKVLQMRAELPGLEWIVVFDMDGLAEFSDPMVISLAEFERLGAAQGAALESEWRARAAAVRPEDTAILIYTSGTTGPPKGAMLSHSNLIFQAASLNIVMPIGPRDELLSFLPLSHIAERLISLLRPIFNGAVVNFAENPDTVPQNLREISPTVFFAVPRIWEKFHSRATIAVHDGTGLERAAFRIAFSLAFRRRAAEAGGGTVPLWLRMAHWAADRTILHRTRKLLGLEQVRYVTTGAAPIAPELIRWYLALGVRMIQAYGLTETAGVASLPPPGQHRLGTVGKALPGTEIRLSAQGEIEIRGPHVFQGYWCKPEQSRATVVDGWLHTGDIGEIDDDGFLRVVDRLKDIIITSGGKNVSPSEIENQLKFSPFISDAIVIGEARPYLTALVMIDYDNIAKYAQDHAIPFTNYASLCAREEIRKLIADEVAAVNGRFARVEQIKTFRLIDVQLTTEDEEFTPTLKLKRSVVGKRHKALIDTMYTAP